MSDSLKSRLDLPKRTILFFDVETTGLSRSTDRLVQIAWIKASEDGVVIQRENHIIKPNGFTIPTSASNIHGITTSLAHTYGSNLNSVLKLFTNCLNDVDFLVGHNISFDTSFIRSELKRNSLSCEINDKISICTMRSSVAWCRLPKTNGLPGFKFPRLGELHFRLFGEDVDGLHDAMVDVEVTMRCFFALRDRGLIVLPNSPHRSQMERPTAHSVTTNDWWLPSHISTLREMWENGETATEIANKLGNVSRLAVIGKAHRMGLKPRNVVRSTECYTPKKSDIGHSKSSDNLPQTVSDAAAQYQLGRIYDTGKGVPKDHSEAARWYRMAAEQGNVAAQYDLGVMYSHGQGVPEDQNEAAHWFKIAVDQGHTEAKFELSDMYENGRGVPKDHIEALRLYRLASAEQGSASDQLELGIIYYDGIESNQDYALAMAWFLKAAEQGNDNAQYNLGVMYYYGQGVDVDFVKSIHWYSLSAQQGNTDAQFNLGVMYENGQGVNKNYAQAILWYQRAARSGDADAISKLLAAGYAVG